MKNTSHTYFAVLAALFALMMWGMGSLSHGPKARGADIAADEFSAARAFVHLEDMISNGKAHPSGSVENLRIRKVIEAKFTAMGYAPEIQKALGCTLHYPGCTRVENIIVRHKGTGSGDAIMLTTHYDSVPAGPAAADDGAGTAALLEVARIIKEGPALKNDTIFLITDGEEGGLRGAQAFADSHSMMKDVKLVVNLESRGASGPSSMFETSAGNLNLIRQYAATSKHPTANSLSYEIYQRLPNDTDYSIYKRDGVAGLNYAFTGDVALYHSIRDDLEHLDKRSLQHHGDNMLTAVHAFGNADITNLIGTESATYIDMFGKRLLHWPSKWNIPLAVFSLLVLGFAAFKGRIGFGRSLSGLGTAILITALTPALGWTLSFPLGRWPDLFYLDHPHPWPGRLAMIFGAICITWLVVRLLKKWISYNGLVWGAGVLFGAAGLALAITMSGASYMFLLPALAIAMGALIDLARKHERFVVAAHLGLALAAYMAYYHFIALEVIIHYKSSHLRIAPLVLLGLALAPLFAGKPTPKFYGYALAGLTIAFAVISTLLPGFNADHPRANNLVYVQGVQAGKTMWASETSGRQDEDFLDAAGFKDTFKPEGLYRILWGGAVAKTTPNKNYKQVIYTLVSDTVTGDVREITMDIQSANMGYAMNIGFDRDNGPTSVSINGQMAADYAKDKYRRPVAIRGPGNDVFRIVIKTAAGKPFDMALIDTFSLPPNQTDGMAALRPDISAPLHSGDRAHIFRLIKFN